MRHVCLRLHESSRDMSHGGRVRDDVCYLYTSHVCLSLNESSGVMVREGAG